MFKLLFRLVLLAVVVVGAGVATAVFLSQSEDSNVSDASATPVSSSSTPGTEMTAGELLQASTERTAEVTSFHFVLSHENGSTPLPLNLELESAEGDIKVPDGMAADVDAEAAGINVSVKIIGIEDRTWVTNPFTRNWQELPGTNIRDFADPAALVSGLLPSIENATLSAGGSVDGVKTHKVTGTIDSGALREALGIAEAGHAVTVEAWIGVDDLLPRLVRLAGPLSGSEESGVVRQVELSRYNEPVEIMPPE